MPLDTKSKIGLLFALMLTVSPAALADTVPVRVGHDGKVTRIVFDFPKLLAYHVNAADGSIAADFDTKDTFAFSALKSPLVSDIKTAPGADGLMQVSISTVPGTTLKHYRLQRKVVIDISSSAAPKPEEKPAPKAEPPKKAESPAPAAPAPAAPVALAPTPAATPAPAAPAAPAVTQVTEAPPSAAPLAPAPAKDISVEQLNAALEDPEARATAKLPDIGAQAVMTQDEPPPPAPPEEPPAPVATDTGEEEARITIAFLTPTRLAAFERSDTLWLVMDNTASNTMPIVSGTMSAFIPQPKVLRFGEGTAYQYTFPKKFYPRVRKSGLSWVVQLMSAPVSMPEDVEIKTSFDDIGRKAKMLVPLKGAGSAIAFEDPTVGDKLFVVPTKEQGQAIRNQFRLTDLEIVPALQGFIVRPLKSGLEARALSDTVFLSSEKGLTVTPEGIGTPVLIGEADEASNNDNNRLFDFPNWRQGGLNIFQRNKRRLQEEIGAAKDSEERASAIMRLAKLFFANNLGHETLGLLEILRTENPEMEKNPDFIAIRGAANAMAGHFREALQDFSYPPIQQNPEVNLWIGYAAAATEQWRMADRSFPKSNRLLLQYPDNISIPFTIYMAESALRLGRTKTAKQLLDTINMGSEALSAQHRAAISYLRGEIFFQEGKFEKAEEVWKPVARGLDRLYHTKASLSLTRLQLQRKEITLQQAVDEIDSLRFAWRGDGLEVETLRMLGGLRVQNGQILAGMQDLQQAAVLADAILDDSAPTREDMKRLFHELFVEGQASKVPPLEAVSVYNEFTDLRPAGAEGITAALDFASYLIRMDLLKQAATVLDEQLENGLPEARVPSVGATLAAICLLDTRPQDALDALKKTERGTIHPSVMEERALLRARALSQLRQTDTAISILDGMSSRNALRLKADVYWRVQQWAAAASTLQSLLPPPKADTPLSDDEAQLAVSTAVAWKLAGNVKKLQELKDAYRPAMTSTKLATTFDVVTRDGGTDALGDRETMLKIAGEVDVFKGFLDSYKAAAPTKNGG